MANLFNQCALNENGNLKSPSKINFYYDKADEVPLHGPDKPQASTANLGCGQHSHNSSQMDAALEAEKLSDTNCVKSKPMRCQRKKKGKKFAGEAEDEDDGDFEGFESDSDSGSSTDASEMVPNTELVSILPSKTIPEGTAKSKHKCTERLVPKVNIEEVEDVDSPGQALPAQDMSTILEKNSPTIWKGSKATARDLDMSTEVLCPLKKSGGKRTNPIYYFYEKVAYGADGKKQDDSVFWKCYHGNRHILAITQKMKSNLNGLIRQPVHAFG
ncbi:hypothetical protein EDD18DRAFT_1357231 [Armillaria luteobubalina]|uniref:Uncharacterized protein n=1 Tax=Armillaria luteobubalina TaxID=153913 RepID=A0AA39PYM4_9AGAR|nr:hypothetical protein EDD18DRAFT_1357231 [Armillaria luteobubalina]